MTIALQLTIFLPHLLISVILICMIICLAADWHQFFKHLYKGSALILIQKQ